MRYKTLVDTKTLNLHQADPDWIIVDCRFDLMQPDAGRAAYVSGHLPGAVYADLNQDLSSPVTPSTGRHPLPDPRQLAEKLGQWGIGPESQVVTYDDRSSAFAVRLWWLLRWLGHGDVAVLDGGLAAWMDADLPVTRDVPHPAPKNFIPKPDPSMLLNTEELKRIMKDNDFELLDARAKPRFLGQVEPIDSIAGHIPGAINRPFEQNLDEQGHFLAAEELRKSFKEWETSSGKVVHMCGSGVTACHNLLAMEIAGLSGSRLYPGSWSEWIRNPENPVT